MYTVTLYEMLWKKTHRGILKYTTQSSEALLLVLQTMLYYRNELF